MHQEKLNPAPAALSLEEIRHIALLARLEMDDRELDEYGTILNRILGHVRQLDELNTDDTPPTSHPAPLVNVLRVDEVRPSLAAEEALANAPGEENNCFKVPQVIQEGPG